MRNSNGVNSSRLELCMRLLDVTALYIAGEIAGRLRFGTLLVATEPIHTIVLYLCCGLAFLLFPHFDVYLSWRGKFIHELMVKLTKAWGLVLLIGIVFSFLIHRAATISRLWLLIWFVVGLTLLMAERKMTCYILGYLKVKGLNRKRVLIVGYGRIGQEIHQCTLKQSWHGYEVDAIQAGFEESKEIRYPVKIISNLSDIPNYLSNNEVHEIWITVPISADEKLLELHKMLRNSLIDIRWMPDSLSMRILSSRMTDFLGFPAFELNRPISSAVDEIFKELFDKIFSLAVLILFSPLLCLIAIYIKCSSPGPILFKQTRLGLNGKKFDVYKFRSMRVHTENGPLTQAKCDDHRVTRIGKFIRRTSIDELPQFINVLIGDMSVVGPRPHALQHNEMYAGLLDIYMLRHRVKPGITGWAQINGYRGETDTLDKMEKRIEFDLDYIQNWSLWMDLKIITWTAFKGWVGPNAF